MKIKTPLFLLLAIALVGAACWLLGEDGLLQSSGTAPARDGTSVAGNKDGNQGDADSPPAVDDSEREKLPVQEQEADRTGDQKSSRRVRVVFQCETAGTQSQAVWKFAGLRVLVEDVHGRQLAECQEPWKPTTFVLPDRVMRIVAVADGYKRKTVGTPGVFQQEDKPAVIQLEPDAVARLRVKNLPEACSHYNGSLLLASRRDPQGEPVHRVFGRHGKTTKPAHGPAVHEYRVPSGLPAKFMTQPQRRRLPDQTREERLDAFVPLHSKSFTLSAGEVREIEIDFAKAGSLDGQLTGVPIAAMAGTSILARSTTSIWVAGWARVDASGQFRLHGLAGRQFYMRLALKGGGHVELREQGTLQNEWDGNERRLLLVEPKEPVLGVVPAQGGTRLRRPFAVSTYQAPGTGGLTHLVPLFTRKILKQKEVHLFVEGIGHFSRSLANATPNREGLYLVEVPAPGGTLHLHVRGWKAGDPEKLRNGWWAKMRSVSDPRRSFHGTRADRGWRFDGLPPDRYRPFVGFHTLVGKKAIRATRVLATEATVKASEETEITVSLPAVLILHGEITNWHSIPEGMRPRTATLLGDRSWIDAEGRFRTGVFAPWKEDLEVQFESRKYAATLCTKEVVFESASSRLLVTFPLGGVRRRVYAKPIAGGGLWLHTFEVDAAGSRVPGTFGGDVLPQDDGSFLIADAAKSFEMILLENANGEDGRKLKLLRGWFRVRPDGPGDLHVAPKGRWIQVAMARANASTWVRPKPPAWWKHRPYGWPNRQIKGKTWQKIWLPDEATGLLTGFDRGEIPASEIEEKVVIGSPGERVR